MSTPKIIIVGGSPRSGTTLVQRLLNSHESIHGGPEFDFLPQISELHARMLKSVNSGRISPWLNEEQLRQSFQTFVQTLLTSKTLSDSSIQFVAEKTPSNCLAFDTLSTILPEAYFIQVVRDPKAVVSSMLEVGKRQKQSKGKIQKQLTNTTQAVKWAFDHCSKAEQQLQNIDKSFTIYYEDLVEEPDKVSKDLSLFLGLEQAIDPKNLSVLEAPQDKNSQQSSFYTKEQLKENLRTDSLDQWSSKLTEAQIQYIDSEFHRIPSIQKRYLLENKISTANKLLIQKETIASHLTRKKLSHLFK